MGIHLGDIGLELKETMSRKEKLTFMLTDLDYRIKKDSETPIIRLFGKTDEGKPVVVNIQDFLPYIYVRKNSELPFILQNDPIVGEWVKKTEDITLRQYFWGSEIVKLVKLYGSNPTKIIEIKQELEKLGFETFETDIPFLKRYLLDTAIKCLNVVEVKCSTFEEREKGIIIGAGFKDVTPASSLEITSPSVYYPLKVMSVNVKILQDEESVSELLSKKNRRLMAISVIWGKDVKPENGKLFLLQEDTDDSEKELIMDFIKYLQKIQPDILTTYQGDSFDLPYFYHRMLLLKIPTQLLSLFRDEPSYYSKHLLSYRIKGRMVFDLALRTWGIHPKSGKKELYDIAEAALGITGYERIEPLKHLWESGIIDDCEDDLRLFAKQCFQDCKIVYDLFWNLGMTGWVETLRVTGFPPYEGNSCTERINGEFELMRYMRRKGILIPPKPSIQQVEKNSLEREKYPHEGGTVLYPEGLLHTGVIIVDFRSMYPSVMVAHNIGGETRKNWVSGADHDNALKAFNTENRSALSIMEKELVEKRIAKKEKIKELTKQLVNIKDQQTQRELERAIQILTREQNSMKIVANAMYGAHYYVRSRFYSQALASAVADTARTYLLGVKEELKVVSEKVISCQLIYGDTDSAFIKLLDNKLILEINNEKDPIKKEALIRLLKDIVASILKLLNEKLPKPIELSLKDIAYRCVFKPNRKKAYAYLSLLTNEIEIKGFEAVRSDWSPISQAAQRKVLEIFLTALEDTSPLEVTQIATKKRRNHNKEEFNKAEKFLLEFGRRILITPIERLFPHVTTYSPIKRHPSQYKSIPPGVYAFLDYCKREGLDSNREWLTYDKFPWIITPGDGAVYKRARHPKYAHDIDRPFYVRQMLLGIRTFGLETSLEDVLSTLNVELPEIVTSVSENDIGTSLNNDSIFPYSVKELTWKNSIKGRKKRREHLVVGQSQLSIYLDSEDD
ncbi:MAG: hypothetical protein EAX90_14675 [Candidatus Heimdallarchaeota archaeon]|nr:hypothetical protein [Candidatus Heimdallarchaeota archaeon]